MKKLTWNQIEYIGNQLIMYSMGIAMIINEIIKLITE